MLTVLYNSCYTVWYAMLNIYAITKQSFNASKMTSL